ncbi:MAG: PrsW family glutamic-type intramembrane protease [Treponema sp.]|nr:PrsW family glutamic-type intramembrane protease [Treponema sp.]
MYGSWVLLVIIFISSIPVIAVFLWFRIAKYNYSIVWFLLALLAGAAAYFPALILQEMLNFSFQSIRAALFFHNFIRIAFTEEISRLLVLLIFFFITSRLSQKTSENPVNSSSDSLDNDKMLKALTTGLVIGFGFSLLETARILAQDMNFAVMTLRIFFTASLHGACGCRIGAAAVMLRKNPLQAALRIFTTVAIHGVFNMMLEMPFGFPSIAAFLIAVCTLITAIITIRNTARTTEKYSE